MINFLNKYFFIFPVIIILLLSDELIGQVNSLDSLRTSISNSENALSKLKLQKNDISSSFNQINDKIYQLKLNLNNSDDPLKRIELNKLLKESNSYADSIEDMNSLIRNITLVLNAKYQNIISVLNEVIFKEQNKFKKETNTQSKINIFEKITLLDKERQKYQDMISTKNPNLNLSLSLDIEPNDSYKTIQLKIDIINDRIHLANDERNSLIGQQKELQSGLSIYQDMLDFMADLRLNIDQEQEFYDQERVNQLRYNIKQIKNKLQNIGEKLKSLDNEEKLFHDKLVRLKKQLGSLLRSINK